MPTIKSMEEVRKGMAVMNMKTLFIPATKDGKFTEFASCYACNSTIPMDLVGEGYVCPACKTSVQEK